MANYISLLRIFLLFSTLFGFQIATGPAMSYEEPKYTVVSETDSYEVRRYKDRTVAEVSYERDNSGFRVLFDYISGANLGSKKLEMTVPVTQSEKIAMTVPVTQSKSNGKMIMRFFLPEEFSMQNAPRPTDTRVRIIDLPEQYFGVISYSGFASESNFEKHREELRTVLLNDGFVITGQPVKATYNSPFTLPFLRRNEAMYPLEWN
ncbi:heme-binding protein [Candidatus Puniceispirillum sp.]|nr:heme-binding protein [Candidatus Puniceispirillum sp.]